MEPTEKLKQEFRKLVRTRREQLLSELREDVERSRDESFAGLAGPVTDLGDEALADLLADLDNAEVSRDLREIRALDAALARLDDGSYGVCIDCGGEIGPERLRAYPTAERCIRCQEVHEKTFAHPGEPRL